MWKAVVMRARVSGELELRGLGVDYRRFSTGDIPRGLIEG